tara:strand:- start:3400 stop:3711 length:312 start_codon:yes stop_codon:yes gene_type:complete
MPTTKDGKEFPYTADGILAAKRHEEFLRKANDQRTMDNSTNGEKVRPEDLPKGIKPRHLDPNHPMNREGTPPRRLQEEEPESPKEMYASKKPAKKKPNPSMYG